MPVWLAIAAAAALAVGTLTPLIAIVGAAAVILTTFAVAGAATLLLLGGLALGFAAIGAAVAFLGAQTMVSGTGAKAVDTGALLTLVTAFDTMKKTLEAQAAPLASMIMLWVAGALPAVTQLGQALMTWFGDRLPGVLKEIGNVISALGPTFGQFASFLGATFDKFSPLIGPLMVQAVQFFIGALTGLINTFGSLVTWFTTTIWLADSFATRQKALGDIVGQVFGAIGAAVIGLAGVWGKFADWLVFQWPNIVINAQVFIKGFGDQWNLMAPTIANLGSNLLPVMGDAIKYIAQHGATLAAVLGLVVTALLLIAAIALSVAASITAITNAIVGATNAVIGFLGASAGLGASGTQGGWVPPARGGYITPPQTSSQRTGSQVSNITVNVQSTKDPAQDGAIIARHMRNLQVV